MPFPPALRSRRRLGAACLIMATALAPFITSTTPAGATDTSCWGQAQTPRTISFYHEAEGVGYLPCAAYYTLKLMRADGVTLASQSGNGTSRLQLYTNWTSCPTGTVVRSYLTSAGAGWSGVTTSAYITCP